MPLICLSSPKGGVGKTTLTANLAFALQRLGLPVTVIDFDVQNALRLHFGLSLGDHRGYVSQAEQTRDWSHLTIETPAGIRLLPYGAADDLRRQHFESRLAEDASFLADGLERLLAIPHMFLLADTPPGPSPALTALNRIADFRVAVLLADAASASLVPQIEQGRFFCTQQARSSAPINYIINQVDRRRRLNVDTTDFLQARLGSDLLGLVHRDEALAEALASQMPIFSFAPRSACAYDIDRIAHQLAQRVEQLSPPSFSNRLQG